MSRKLADYLLRQSDYYRAVGSDEARFVSRLLEDAAATVGSLGISTWDEYEHWRNESGEH